MNINNFDIQAQEIFDDSKEELYNSIESLVKSRFKDLSTGEQYKIELFCQSFANLIRSDVCNAIETYHAKLYCALKEELKK